MGAARFLDGAGRRREEKRGRKGGQGVLDAFCPRGLFRSVESRAIAWFMFCRITSIRNLVRCISLPLFFRICQGTGSRQCWSTSDARHQHQTASHRVLQSFYQNSSHDFIAPSSLNARNSPKKKNMLQEN